MHQLRRAADVFQAGPQFHHRQGPGRGHDGHGLVQGQRLRGPAFLAFGGVGQGGDVAGDQVAGFGVPDGALERQVPHGNCGGGVAGGDLAAPQPRAVPVAVRVAAGASVFEGDAVFAAPAPGCHGGMIVTGGDNQW